LSTVPYFFSLILTGQLAMKDLEFSSFWLKKYMFLVNFTTENLKIQIRCL
jgi:hypothetical protein